MDNVVAVVVNDDGDKFGSGITFTISKLASQSVSKHAVLAHKH